jgi:hypothetical protein
MKPDRIKEINDLIRVSKAKHEIDSADMVSDGYHTFKDLYHHRMVLFVSICNIFSSTHWNDNIAWKSLRHSNGDLVGDDMFIIGIQTPYGQATYHCDLEPYWDMAMIPELDRAPEYDGHTPEEALDRIYKFLTNHCKVILI